MPNIVIVEDNRSISDLYTRFVKQLGFSFMASFTKGEQVVKFMKSKPDVDLILMDIELEGQISGVDAAAKIRSFSDVPVLFVSGCSLASVSAQITGISSSAFTPKVFDSSELGDIIRNNFSDKFSSIIPANGRLDLPRSLQRV